jgi:hypothetical protein
MPYINLIYRYFISINGSVAGTSFQTIDRTGRFNGDACADVFNFTAEMLHMV